MRNSIKEAIGDTVQKMLNAGFKTSFTQEELDVLEVKIPETHMTSGRIWHIREEKS